MALWNWIPSSQSLSAKLNPVRQRILNDPYYRLRSLQEVAIAAELGLKLDVNRASVDDWLRLPGISIHQARSLVELSGMGVQFLCLEDLAAALSVSIGRLKPLEPVLYFSYYDPDSLEMPLRINPNTASVEQLLEIPLINPTLAEKIVSDRLQNGLYRNLANLQQRLNLNRQLIAQLMHYLNFS